MNPDEKKALLRAAWTYAEEGLPETQIVLRLQKEFALDTDTARKIVVLVRQKVQERLQKRGRVELIAGILLTVMGCVAAAFLMPGAHYRYEIIFPALLVGVGVYAFIIGRTHLRSR